MTGRVAGLDLSLTSTGIATVDNGVIVGLHNVTSKGKRSDTLEDRRERLFDLANAIVDHVAEFGPELVVIEAPSFGSRFGSAHDRAGLWWAVASPLIADFPVAQVSPQGRAKYGTGKGNSKKDVVLAHVLERYSDIAPRRIKNDDEADALLLAAIGARQLGAPVEPSDLPEDNLAALNGVAWPTVTVRGA